MLRALTIRYGVQPYLNYSLVRRSTPLGFRQKDQWLLWT